MDDHGRFTLTAKGKPKSIQVIKEGMHLSHNVFPDEDLRAIKIP